MTDDAKIVVAAVLSALALLGLMAFLAWAGLDWKKWVPFAICTTVVFGYLAFKYGDDIKRPRCLLLFVALLIAHVSGSVYYLRSVDRFPPAMWVFTVFETGVAAFLMIAVGGARGSRSR